MTLHDFLTDLAGRGVLLQVGERGVRGLVHDVTDTSVVLWNPTAAFQEIPFDAIDGYTAWGRMDGLAVDYARCTTSMTCPLHYPAA